MTTSRRKEINNHCSQNNPVVLGTIESDNHAEISCFGPSFVMDHFMKQTYSVSGYNKKVQSTEICIGIGLTMWADPTSGKLQLLQGNQGLDMQHILDDTIVNHNQCRSFGVS